MRYIIANDLYVDSDEKGKMSLINSGYVQSVLYVDAPLVEQVALSYSVPALDEEYKDVLLLGVGLAENIVQIKNIKSGINIDAVDIRRDLYDFLIQQKIVDEKMFTFIHEAAEDYMRECAKKYDCIIMDVFQDRSMPRNCLEVSFYKDLFRCLNERGILIINTNLSNEYGILKYLDVNNALWFYKKIIFTAGFKTILQNDIFDMGILYIFKEKKDRHEFVDSILKIYKEMQDEDVKAALLSCALKCCQTEEDDISEKKNDDNVKAELETRKYYIRKRTKRLIRIYNCSLSDEVLQSTVNYLYKKMNVDSMEKIGVLNDDYINQIYRMYENRMISRNDLINKIYIDGSFKSNLENKVCDSYIYDFLYGICLVQNNEGSRAHRYLYKCIYDKEDEKNSFL